MFWDDDDLLQAIDIEQIEANHFRGHVAPVQVAPVQTTPVQEAPVQLAPLQATPQQSRPDHVRVSPVLNISISSSDLCSSHPTLT